MNTKTIQLQTKYTVPKVFAGFRLNNHLIIVIPAKAGIHELTRHSAKKPAKTSLSPLKVDARKHGSLREYDIFKGIFKIEK